ncbi:hypothetical protein GZL_04678 [Streptomyces sp. 769]|nr:hypothetical protein GZL_04678 [Streptomyces sp. 769]
MGVGLSLGLGDRLRDGGPAQTAPQPLMPNRTLPGRDVVDATERPRVAPQNAPGGQRSPLHRAVPVDGCVAIVRTRRVVLADRAQQRADGPLVDLDQKQQRVLHCALPPGSRPGFPGPAARPPSVTAPVGLQPFGAPPSSRSKAASRSRASWSYSAAPAPGRARTTTRLPAGSRSSRSRTRWRSLRLTLVRTTAPPTALLTTKPARAGGTLPPAACGSVAPLRQCTTRSGRPALRPLRTAVAKSSRRLSRCSVGSTSWT